MTDIPFGERKLKLTSGEKLVVPDVIRNIIPTRIVSQYLAYCKETIDGNDFKPLAPSSLFAILQKCTASTRKSLAGLDNFGNCVTRWPRLVSIEFNCVFFSLISSIVIVFFVRRKTRRNRSSQASST
jgi:hypothetical protein